MRHGKEGKKFNRKTGERRSFLRNLVNDLFRAGKIETTETRAKAIRPLAERYISIAKKQTLSSRRLLLSRMQSPTLVSRLMDEIGPKYKERAGGYLRIVKSGKSRKRDGSRLAVIEFV
jgi:large subunit ribosomal protein L17